MLHKNIAEGELHSIANWVVVDEAARLALVPAATDVHKICFQQDTSKYYGLTDDAPATWTLINPDAGEAPIVPVYPYDLYIAVGDETTAITAGVGKVSFRMARGITLSAVIATLVTAQTGGTVVTVDINANGVSILSTKLTIDNAEKTSTTAATPAVISDTGLAADEEITIDIDTVGDGTAKGLKIMLVGTVA